MRTQEQVTVKSTRARRSKARRGGILQGPVEIRVEVVRAPASGVRDRVASIIARMLRTA